MLLAGSYPCSTDNDIDEIGPETNCTFTMTAASQGEDLPFNLTDRDRKILSLTEEEFHPHTWEELKQIIGTSIADSLYDHGTDDSS